MKPYYIWTWTAASSNEAAACQMSLFSSFLSSSSSSSSLFIFYFFFKKRSYFRSQFCCVGLFFYCVCVNERTLLRGGSSHTTVRGIDWQRSSPVYWTLNNATRHALASVQCIKYEIVMFIATWWLMRWIVSPPTNKPSYCNSSSCSTGSFYALFNRRVGSNSSSSTDTQTLQQ